jgi:hypothetical protein
MGQVTFLSETRDGFPPLQVGREVMFFFEDRDRKLALVNGFVQKLTDQYVVVDDINVDGSTTRFNVAKQDIVERFM